MLEGIGLIPTIWEDIERDFTANRESQTIISELVFEFFDECSPDTVGLFKLMRTLNREKQIGTHSVVHLEFIALLYTGSRLHLEWKRHSAKSELDLRGVASYGADVDHPISELDERAPVRNVRG